MKNEAQQAPKNGTAEVPAEVPAQPAPSVPQETIYLLDAGLGEELIEFLRRRLPMAEVEHLVHRLRRLPRVTGIVHNQGGAQ